MTAGSSLGGRSSRASISSRSPSAADEEKVSASVGSPSADSHAKRSTRTRVLPVPAPPMTSSGPPGWRDGLVLGGGEHLAA